MELAPAHMQPAPQQPIIARLVNTRQAAQILAVSPRTVQNLIASGDLATVKIATATRLWLDDVLAYAQRRTRRAYGSGNSETE